MVDKRLMLRIAVSVFGVVASVLLLLASLADVLMFMLAYNGPLGSYTGQAGDRHKAWLMMIWLAVGWVVVLGGMVVPALRWRRLGLLDGPAE